MSFSTRGPKMNREQRQSQADAALAAFRDKGGVVSQMPSMVATSVRCQICGHTGIIGMTEGKPGRCPKCRAPIHKGS